MADRRRLISSPVAAGSLAVGCTILAAALAPVSIRESLRERALDQTLAMSAFLRPMPAQVSPVLVIDIDSKSLDAIGPWPWPRATIAALVDAAARSGASALAIDILFAGADAKSPANLARRLGQDIHRPDIVALADALPDGDKRLGESLGRLPVALGFALDPERAGQVPSVPILTRGELALQGIWRGAGAIGPTEALIQTAAGMGTLALPGDADGLVRRVPLFVGVGDRVHPGLALEAIRLAQGASAYRLGGNPPSIEAGNAHGALPPDGFLRLVPSGAAPLLSIVISASEVLGSEEPMQRLRDAIVLIGSSAPELGGLRPSPSDPLTPSVMIQAAAVSQFLRGIVPLPVTHASIVDVGLAIAAVILGILAAALMRPVAGAVVVMFVVCACWIAAIAAAGVGRLLDPLPPSVLAAVAFAATAIIAFAEANRREARIRRRFEQHLAPQVVELIASDPSVLKLRGQRREITALFTDVEGFTAMTHRAEPEMLVRVLDDYFEGVAKIIIAHGGMIDKLVGDAVHALFNTPVDLPGHPMKALRCAMDIRSWTESYCLEELPAALGFRRTRIGIETGEAIVGDIGIRSKLDYTAHGDTVNAAARFEAANKEIGSSICVGPQAASRCDPTLLRPTGEILLRGFTTAVPTFEPWPDDADQTWRSRYLEAVALAANDAEAGAHGLAALAAERPHDPVPLNLANRARSRAPGFGVIGAG